MNCGPLRADTLHGDDSPMARTLGRPPAGMPDGAPDVEGVWRTLMTRLWQQLSGDRQLECRTALPTWKEFGELIVQSYRGWMADRAPRLGASLAFYTLLSLAPIVIVVIAIASIAFGQKAAQGRLIWQIQDLVGWQGALAIQS